MLTRAPAQHDGTELLPVTMRTVKLRRLLTSPIRRFPDFVIIGAQKGGTTTLYNYLKRHPGVAAASRKEIFFFDLQYDRGSLWYRAHFPSLASPWPANRLRRHPLMTGEATPNYFFHPHAARRMRATIPHVKLIVLLRNPIDRAYSHYHHQVLAGREPLSFEEALAQEPTRLDGELEKMLADERYHSVARHRFSYLARGIYLEQLTRWEERFPPAQLLVLNSEAFYADPVTTLNRVTEYLGLPRWTPSHVRKDNVGKQYPPMSANTRAVLIDDFRPHNQRLSQHLGKDVGWDR